MTKPRRIALVGTSGAGKTTLGRDLARCLGTVFVKVDALRHKANWVRATPEELRDAVEARIGERESWIIDNTCWRPLGDVVSRRADLIVWLDLPLPLKLLRLCRRSWHRVRTQEPLWNGNTESWRDVIVGKDSVLIYALSSHVRHRRTFYRQPDAHKILRLRTPTEVETWLDAQFPDESGR